jgi:hypothetical protein
MVMSVGNFSVSHFVEGLLFFKNENFLFSFILGLINSPVLPKQTFDIDEKTGEWILHERDVECISIGAGILGCGGGGSPHIARLRALNLLKQGKKMRVISPDK